MLVALVDRVIVRREMCRDDEKRCPVDMKLDREAALVGDDATFSEGNAVAMCRGHTLPLGVLRRKEVGEAAADAGDAADHIPAL